jgi:hypothetical protein
MADRIHKIQEGRVAFHCPGCGYAHFVGVPPSAQAWKFNGDFERPTFTPSVLVAKDQPEQRCHSFIIEGKIRFLTDCHHNLAGQTVDLPAWENRIQSWDE